jgi:predicted RNA-binding protein
LNVEYASLSHTEFVGLLKKKEENSEVSVSSPFLHCPEEVIEQKRSADDPGK